MAAGDCPEESDIAAEALHAQRDGGAAFLPQLYVGVGCVTRVERRRAFHVWIETRDTLVCRSSGSGNLLESGVERRCTGARVERPTAVRHSSSTRPAIINEDRDRHLGSRSRRRACIVARQAAYVQPPDHVHRIADRGDAHGARRLLRQARQSSPVQARGSGNPCVPRFAVRRGPATFDPRVAATHAARARCTPTAATRAAGPAPAARAAGPWPVPFPFPEHPIPSGAIVRTTSNVRLI